MENFEEPLGDERRRLLEQELRKDLHQFLLSMKEVDERMPECPDVEEKWEEIAKTYIPDGIREFQDFPSASLGWMMYIGMAVAKMWDTEWEIYSKIEDLYAYMRDKRGYDAMDEYIREDVLLLQGVDYSVLEKVTDTVLNTKLLEQKESSFNNNYLLKIYMRSIQSLLGKHITTGYLLRYK